MRGRRWRPAARARRLGRSTKVPIFRNYPYPYPGSRFRRSRRSRRRRRAQYQVSRALGGFPTSRSVKLRYVTYANLDASATGVATVVFRANHLFDPDYATGGHQPMWFDNYSAIYSRFRVNMATIEVTNVFNKIVNTAVPITTSGTYTGSDQFYIANERAVRMFVIRDASPTDFNTNIDNMIEVGNENFKWVWAPQNTSRRMTKLKYKVTPSKLLNVSRRDDILKKSVDGSDVDTEGSVYFIVGVSSLDSTNNPSLTRVYVKITYYVTFMDIIENQAQQ